VAIHKNILIHFFIFQCCLCLNSQSLKTLNTDADFGDIESAAMLKTTFILFNQSSQKAFIMRADASKNVLVQTSKKIIEPNDSASIQVTFTPTSKGKFSEKIKVYSSTDEKHYLFSIKGNILKLETDNLTSCVIFDPKITPNTGTSMIPVYSEQNFKFIDSLTAEFIDNATLFIVKPNNGLAESFDAEKGKLKTNIPVGNYHFEAIAEGYFKQSKDFYIGYSSGSHTFVLSPLKKTVIPPEITYKEPEIIHEEIIDDSELSVNKYAANNIIFLIDVSRSMKIEDRLPLLQKSIGRMLEPIRAIDYITVITYANGPELLIPPLSGERKNEIKQKVDALEAKGSTSGSKGLQMAYEIAEKHFIENGNNQIIIASDGAFSIDNKDKKMISSAAENTEKHIIISAVALGTNRNTHQMLKEIATLGQGSFMHLQNPDTDIEALINEIKLRSAK
jgi:Mg-chelatase subunit ChlD